MSDDRRRKLTNVDKRHYLVGSKVTLVPGPITGTVVDLILDNASGRTAFVIVVFDVGADRPPLYQPIRWNLLRYVTGIDGYVVQANAEALDDEPAALSVAPLTYGDNMSISRHRFGPLPQSLRIH
jgi:hypothetical protein